jgi:hypothetical protein
MMSSLPRSSNPTPNCRRQAAVLRQSAPRKKPLILPLPSLMARSINALWEMDLSPGTAILPWMFLILLTVSKPIYPLTN